MSAGTRRRLGAERGFTLVEVLLALSLLSILLVALVNLIDTSLRIWGRTESQRDLVEIGGAVTELLAHDLSELEAGPRGDLLGDWWTFDLDGDTTPGAPLARLRLIKRPSRAELARRFPGGDSDLVEVVWALLPAPRPSSGPDANEPRDVAMLVRGERLYGDEDTKSFFDKGFFTGVGKPPGGATELVTGGVLWFEAAFASQTSVVNDGWSIGGRAHDAATAWDAWAKDRPDVGRTTLNDKAAALPSPDDEPILPRRVKVRIEFERRDDLRHRPRLLEPLETQDSVLVVDDELRLPKVGTMILVDEEWMEVRSLAGRRVTVKRGVRGTTPRQHDAGAMLHHGWAVVREVSVPLYREDWDL